MPWKYTQHDGNLSLDGKFMGSGYSGKGPGKNTPSMQKVPNIGPIPVGTYHIGPAFTHPEKGPLVMHLYQFDGNEMFGRDGFLIHGDAIHDPGNASEGCIIMNRAVRQEVSDNSDRTLTVVAYGS